MTLEMKNSCFWSTVALVTVLLCLETVRGAKLYKVNEVGNRPVDGVFCGQIGYMYGKLCQGNRKRRSTLMDEQEALSFLLHHRSRRSTGGTDIVEECCDEGCAYEEIFEYC
ncbi:insulin-like peptide 03 isoform X1 [Oculina patagonica]